MKAIEFMDKQDEDGHIDTFHILTGKPTRITDLPKIIGKHLDLEPEIQYTEARTYDVEKFYGNPEKARNVLGYSARVEIDEGIKRTIDSLKKVVI